MTTTPDSPDAFFRSTLPAVYEPALDLRATERAIKHIKDRFEVELARALNLTRVSAPLVVRGGTGVNDHLDGIQKPVSLEIKALGGPAEIVQSLAKWKRLALADYGFACGEGLYTDMNAIRPDEVLSNLHSVYVDQWDWELVLDAEARTVVFLEEIVRKLYTIIRGMDEEACRLWPELGAPFLPPRITFVHSQDLEDQYPSLSPREREDAFCREHGAVFVIGIGAPLASGVPHDARAADYDDWITEGAPGRPGLNGDILVWYPALARAVELSSMGIRVDAGSLRRQLELHGEQDRAGQAFHQRVLGQSVPSTIGGGIGQSRLCMLLLRKLHVGEVQAGVWPDAMLEACEQLGIKLL